MYILTISILINNSFCKYYCDFIVQREAVMKIFFIKYLRKRISFRKKKTRKHKSEKRSV